MVLSTNQARQFYVMEGALKTTAPSAAKEVQAVVTDPKAPYIIAYGAAGPLRSALLTNIESVKVTDAGAMATPLKKADVVIDTPTTAMVGKDCIIKIVVRQFAGISDEETYSIYASARVNSASTAATIAADLASNLQKSLKKMVSTLFTVSVSDDTITIQEVEQEWTLGIKEQVPVYFDVFLVPIDENVTPSVSGAVTTYDYGTVTTGTNGTIANGKKVADMEYFYMGERGDIYRNINWPNSIHTDYLVDASVAYDVLDIHYSYVGSNESVQKSEADLTVVTPHSNAANLASLANTLAKAAGLSAYKKVDATGAIADVTVA